MHAAAIKVRTLFIHLEIDRLRKWNNFEKSTNNVQYYPQALVKSFFFFFLNRIVPLLRFNNYFTIMSIVIKHMCTRNWLRVSFIYFYCYFLNIKTRRWRRRRHRLYWTFVFTLNIDFYYTLIGFYVYTRYVCIEKYCSEEIANDSNDKSINHTYF